MNKKLTVRHRQRIGCVNQAINAVRNAQQKQNREGRFERSHFQPPVSGNQFVAANILRGSFSAANPRKWNWG
jgi:hypothetical protein